MFFAQLRIDNLFSLNVMLETPGGDMYYSRLRIELSMDEWQTLGNPGRLDVYIDPRDIMLLREWVVL